MTAAVDTRTGEASLLVHPAAEMFPLLGDEELGSLAADITANGLRYPVVLDREGRVLDGRNRLAACDLAGVHPRFETFQGDDPVAYVVSVNLKRRHLTTGQKAMLAVELLPLFEAQAKARQARKPESVRAELHTQTKRAADDAAKVTGVSGRAVAQAKRVAEEAPDLAEQVKAGLPIDRADRIVRDRQSAAKRQARAAATVEHQTAGTTVDIRHGDFRDVLADLSDVDAIITDPPYPREYLPLLADLAAWADKALTPDGVLAVLFGQTYLPEVYRLLDGHRPYRWTMCYLTPGAAYTSMSARLQSNWKPVLVYGGGPRFNDTLRADGATDAAAKSRHEWGQDYGAFETLVDRLTEPGQTVVDPFMGSGTTLLAAKTLGRHAIGCDTDEQHVATARERLS